MLSFKPSLDQEAAITNLDQIVSPSLDSTRFLPAIQSLQRLFDSFAAYCPPPWPAPGLLVTHEINYQSELWLPLAEIQPHFEHLYQSALIYPPIYASSPFAQAVSWAALVATYPQFLKRSVNPAYQLEQLCNDSDLRAKFLFWSFMPRRFYGSSTIRYPQQAKFLKNWLANNKDRLMPNMRCLDAACGDGAATYDLARSLLDAGIAAKNWEIEGWTLEPLEVWAAAFGRFPHEPAREAAFRLEVASVFARQAHEQMIFRQVDLRESSIRSQRSFDLILCNGLLGGPIISQKEELSQVVENLADLLSKGGILLAADHFHGGWKKNIPGETLGDIFKQYGLEVSQAGEGLCGLKPDQ